MFYFLSKLLDFLIQPYNVLLIGLIIVFFKVKGRGAKWLTGSIFLAFCLCSNIFLVGALETLWAHPPKKVNEIDRQYDVGVVLSGGLLYSGATDPDIIDLEVNSDRLMAAFVLYKKGICKKLLLTGTDAVDLLREGRGEVQQAQSLLISWGVPAEDIILELRARNTRENAVFTANMLEKSAELDGILLITSAFHMRRAKACFDKVGLTVETFPADNPADLNGIPLKRLLLPDARAFVSFQRLWREWVGMLTYKLAGYC